MTKIEFYIPHSIELLIDFFGPLGIKMDGPYTQERKQLVLDAIYSLLVQKIIFVGEYKENIFLKWKDRPEEIISRIDRKWNEDIKFSDFYNCVWFGSEQWYVEALKAKNLDSASDWEKFVGEKIGDLEAWIEENKPKD